LACGRGGGIIERGIADTLWQIARQIENHADALKEQWEAALQKHIGWKPTPPAEWKRMPPAKQ
jgi:hypothetical protein